MSRTHRVWSPPEFRSQLLESGSVLLAGQNMVYVSVGQSTTIGCPWICFIDNSILMVAWPSSNLGIVMVQKAWLNWIKLMVQSAMSIRSTIFFWGGQWRCLFKNLRIAPAIILRLWGSLQALWTIASSHCIPQQKLLWTCFHGILIGPGMSYLESITKMKVTIYHLWWFMVIYHYPITW